MNYFTIATATVIAQLGLVASYSNLWAPSPLGNTGQCVVEPQPGYHFTALQICTTAPTEWSNGYADDTFYMNGSLYSAFLTAGSDPAFAVPQPWDWDFWINTMQYGVDSGRGNQPSQFYPPYFDINACTQYACQDDQPCAFWGNTGSPWDSFGDAQSFTWWDDTPQNNYGPGNGYLVLDYVSQEQTLNERNTANKWFDCKRATQPPCTDIAGVVVNYLYDCNATIALPAPGGKQYNSGLNNHPWGSGCAGGQTAIAQLLEVVKLYYNGSDKRALTTQPIYCTDAGGPDICVFYRGVATGNGSTTYDLLTQLNGKYSTDTCGSIGVEYPKNNVEAYGFLTVGQKGLDCIFPNKITLNNFEGTTMTLWACKGFPYTQS